MLNKEHFLLLTALILSIFVYNKAKERTVLPKVEMKILKSKEKIKNIHTIQNISFSEKYIIDSIDFLKKRELIHAKLGNFGYDKNFYIELKSVINVHQRGFFDFLVDSDDGFVFFHNHKKISEYPYTRAHKESKVSVFLEKGIHHIKINYFQGEGLLKLKVMYKLENAQDKYIFGKDSKYISFLDVRKKYDNSVSFKEE